MTDHSSASASSSLLTNANQPESTSLKPHWLIINYAIYIISNICCFVFLAILMTFALVSYFYRIYIKNDHTYSKSKSNKLAYPTDVGPVLRRANLRYYVQLMGLELYDYRIMTKDGFIISLQRVVDLNSSQSPDTKKPVLMIHGLLQSSGSFVTSGYKSLTYLLVKNGYDVWLGNNRCGFTPQHRNLNDIDPKMWDWDLTEMTKFDLTRMIDEVLNHSTHSKVSLIGHSQGTAQIVMLLSREYDLNYHTKVANCTLLAPAIFGGPLLDEKLFIRFIKCLPNSIYNIFFGITSFMPIMMLLRSMIVTMPVFGLFSYSMFSFLFDWNDYLWDHSLRPIHFIFSPVYISSKLMKWWLSNKSGQGFQNGKSILKDERLWFDSDTPKFFMVIGGEDKLVDGGLFINHLRKNEPFMDNKFSFLRIDRYSHLDVLWADDVIEVVGESLLSFLES